MQITKADFDNAVKQPWNRTTCVAAQFIKRVTGKYPTNSWSDVDTVSVWRHATNKIIHATVTVFDEHFRNPGDENKPELQELRASLPITI